MTKTVGTMNEWNFYKANDAHEDEDKDKTWSNKLDLDLPTYKAALENNAEFNVLLLNR